MINPMPREILSKNSLLLNSKETLELSEKDLLKSNIELQEV
jgi:hypothetical protein